MVDVDVDWTDIEKLANGGNSSGGNPDGGNDGDQGENPLG